MQKILFLKLKKPFLAVIIFTLLILAGCSSSNIQEVQTGLIRGRVQFADQLGHNLKSNIPSSKDKGLIQISNSVSLNTIPIETTLDSPEEYIIKFNQSLTNNYIKKQILKGQGKIIKKIIGDNTYKIKFINSNNKNLITSLENNPLVAYIEPEYLVHIQTIPDDPEYFRQWNLKMLELDKTWINYQGSNDVIVAVLDTGVLINHPDLRDHIIPGYDFIDNDNNPTDTDPNFSHGTHVAGIIGAMTNNGLGVAGINWNVKIMPVRVIGPAGSGGYSDLISGIRWAVKHGANVINLSLAGSVDSYSLREAIDYALDNGVTVVAAAGNNNSTPILYPAQYPEVISVGAIGPTKEKAYYSNYGSNLDLVAPGGDSSIISTFYNTILSTAGHLNSTQPIYQYSWAQGTSMATPHVSGLVALLYSAGITDPAYIEQHLKLTATDLGPIGWDNEYGAGLININQALNLIDNNEDSINHNSPNPTLDSLSLLEEVEILVTKKENELNEEVLSKNPDSNGNFAFELNPGIWSISGWIDTNNNEKVDQGDYYDRVENIIVEANSISCDVNLKLKKL